MFFRKQKISICFLVLSLFICIFIESIKYTSEDSLFFLAPQSILKVNTVGSSFSADDVDGVLSEGDFFKISFLYNVLLNSEGAASKSVIKLAAWIDAYKSEQNIKKDLPILTEQDLFARLSELKLDKRYDKAINQIASRAKNLFNGQSSVWYLEFYDLLALLKARSMRLDTEKFLKNYNNMLKLIEKKNAFRVFASPLIWENIITHSMTEDSVFQILKVFTTAVKTMKPEIAEVLLDKSLLYEIASTGEDAPEKFITIFKHAYTAGKIKDKSLRDKIYNRNLLFEANSNCLGFVSIDNYYPYNNFSEFSIVMKKNPDYLKDILDADVLIGIADKYKGHAETVNKFIFNLYTLLAENKIKGASNLKNIIHDVVFTSKDSRDCVDILGSLIDVVENIRDKKYPEDLLESNILHNIVFHSGGYRSLSNILDKWDRLQSKIFDNKKYDFFKDFTVLEQIVKFTRDVSNDVIVNIVKNIDLYPNADNKLIAYISVFSLYADFNSDNMERFIQLWDTTDIKDSAFDIRDMYLFFKGNGFINSSSILNGDMPSDFVAEDKALLNMSMIKELDVLVDANNEAMKLLGSTKISKDIALEALGNVRKMLNSYSRILNAIPGNSVSSTYTDTSIRIDEKLNEFIDYFERVEAPDNILSDSDVKKIREITTGQLRSVQDIIISLHQNSIQMLFDYYTGEKESNADIAGGEIIFNDNIKVIDVLSKSKRERLSSAVLFLKDFFNHTDYAFSNERLKNIVLGNKVYHFFKMGFHTAKISLDLNSPQVGGHILFQYNENTNGDEDGVPIRQSIVAQVCKRLGMKVSQNGLNLNVVYNQESGASHIDDLIDIYSKLWHFNKILTMRELKGAWKYDDFHHSSLGKEYRELKDKSLSAIEKDDQLINTMVDNYASLIMKNITENFASADDVRQRSKKVFETVTGESIDEFLMEESVISQDVLKSILNNDVLTKDSFRNAQLFEGIKDMVKWEKELFIGSSELISAQIELGYNHNVTIYALRDLKTSELYLGWAKDNITGKSILDSELIYKYVRQEGYYPLTDYAKVKNLTPKRNITDILNDQSYSGFSNLESRDSAKGLPVSEGSFEGEVILYQRGKHKASDLTGKVVIVDYLTPEDDTVVRSAGALILLGGGNLSHGAIFAREMKIPAVILNNFNMFEDKIKGTINKLDTVSDSILVNEKHVSIQRFEKQAKDWSINEGFVLHVDGKEGAVKDISPLKKELIVLLRDISANKTAIINLLKENQIFLDLVFKSVANNSKHTDFRDELLTLYPSLKKYQQKVLEIKKAKTQNIIKETFENIQTTKDLWVLLNQANVIKKIIENDVDNLLSESEIATVRRSLAELLLQKDDEMKWLENKDLELVDYIDVDYKRLSEVDETYMPVLGNKAAKLGEVYQAMENAGADVPDGIALSSKIFDEFMDIPLDSGTLRDAIKTIMSSVYSVKDKSEKIFAVIDYAKNTEAYHSLALRMEQIYKEQWGDININLAVRSSAIRKGKQLEDTVGTAGLYESYMFVHPTDLFERVVDVWSSLYAERALSYYDNIMEGDIGRSLVDELSMAVVIQEHIDSEKSGVVFSVNPANGENKTVISSGLGQGEGVVQGIIPVDTFFVSRNGLIEEKYISSKDDMMVKKEDSKELIKVNTQQYLKTVLGDDSADEITEMLKGQVLTDRFVHRISALATYLQDYFGYPVDMEFAVKDGSFYLTQVRMITTLGVDEGKSFLKDILQENVFNEFGALDKKDNIVFLAEKFSSYMQTNSKLFQYFNIEIADILSEKITLITEKEQRVDNVEDARSIVLTAA